MLFALTVKFDEFHQRQQPDAVEAILTIDALIRQIASLQNPTGLFPSYRHNQLIGYRRADTNVFFTASTVFILRNLHPVVSAESQKLIDHIASRAVAAFPVFQNKDGLDTYNFWPTRPSQHFPNGHLFRYFDHFRIPDDIDDTAMVYLTAPPAAETLTWLKAKAAQHANGSQPHLRILNTFPEYRDLWAYSTWFGKNMGIDFDACALSNWLYFVYEYDLPRNRHDADSLTYLRLVVDSGRYLSEPFQCAPHYARPSLIGYHIARLMAAFDPPELAPIRQRLIADAHRELARTTYRMEKMLWAIALFRLGQTPSAIDLTNIETEFSTFHFFIAGLLTAYQQPALHRFADQPLMQMRWQCEAHFWALVAEYLGQLSKKSA